jgi:rhodanese-related sulfurtransferase
VVHVSRAGALLRGVLRRLRPPDPVAPARSAPLPPTDDSLGEPPLEVERPIPGSLLVDIREPGELASGVAEGALLLPMNLVPHHLADLPRDRALTIYCAAGARSFGVAHWLREQGFPQAYSLAGGIGVFDAIGHPVTTPPGVVPGTRVQIPADAHVEGRALGAPAWGEVIQQLGPVLQAVVQDEQGFLVRVELPAPEGQTP